MKKIRALQDIDASGDILKAGTILEIVESAEDRIVVRIPDGEYCAGKQALKSHNAEKERDSRSGSPDLYLFSSSAPGAGTTIPSTLI